MVIDVFSKYGWAVPLKSKKGTEDTNAFKTIFSNGTYKYIVILQPLIDKYNRTKHRSIGCTPIEARQNVNHDKVTKNL